MENLTINNMALLTSASLSVMALKVQERTGIASHSALDTTLADEQVQPQVGAAEPDLGISIAFANEQLKRHSIGLEFTLLHVQGQDIVQLRDTSTGQILREYTSQAILTTVAALSTTVSGLLYEVA